MLLNLIIYAFLGKYFLISSLTKLNSKIAASVKNFSNSGIQRTSKGK